jgi:hypothetical protein
MLRITNLKNKYQKRLIRPLYAQTQATPYAAVLADSLRDSAGDWTFTGASFKYKGGLVPGTVMVNRGEQVSVATGADAALRPFGLLANFVGGELDDLKDEDFVGVWRGPDAVFEILAPGFDDTGLSAAWDASTPGLPVPLYAGVDGRLSYVAVPGNRIVVAHLIERPNANRIVVDLRV